VRALSFLEVERNMTWNFSYAALSPDLPASALYDLWISAALRIHVWFFGKL